MVSSVTAVVTAVQRLRNFPQSENLPSLGALLAGWRDLNSRPLDPQIGPPQISGVNYLSLVSMVDR
jgi:hypothetical protein